MCQKLENSQRLFRFIIYLIFNGLIINEKFYLCELFTCLCNLNLCSLLVYMIYLCC